MKIASSMTMPHVWINHFVAQELNKYSDCGVNLANNQTVIPDSVLIERYPDGTPVVPDPLNKKLSGQGGPGNVIPFFPASPTNVEQVYADLLNYSGTDNPLLVSYDRMLRLRPDSFYVRKREQLMYYIYNGSVDVLFNAGNVISQLLDREDVAAQQINRWMTLKQHSDNPLTDADGSPLELNMFFRNFKVYQANEARDLVQLGTVKTVFANKYIIEYDYHTKDQGYI